ncbi:MAG: F0F1 ATP synthase subunit A [Candidatus Gracilibacteria bacterium]|nr:F0F1 ATP synthase subunit A [Candidatus Gracilibacteria bacterium]
MESQNTEATTEVHTGPHIPAIQGEQVSGYVTNTIITTSIFFFMVLIVSIMGNKALKSEKKSRLKLFFLNFVGFFDTYLTDSFGNKKFARNYYHIVVGIFSIIFFGNLFGLIIDWLGSGVSNSILLYLRPMNSDPNTTFVLAMITIIMFLGIGVKTHGFTSTAKSYCFNFTGPNIGMKLINVFVGWLHLIGLPSTLTSLSLRLFGNIFAGIVLIGVITYLGGMMSESLFEVGKFLSLPFWFFEVFVAFIQAVVFAGLIIANFKQAAEEHH